MDFCPRWAMYDALTHRSRFMAGLELKENSPVSIAAEAPSVSVAEKG